MEKENTMMKIKIDKIELFFVYLLLFISFYQPVILGVRSTLYIPAFAFLLAIKTYRRYQIAGVIKSRAGNLILGFIVIELYLLVLSLILQGNTGALLEPLHVIVCALFTYLIREYARQMSIGSQRFLYVMINVGLTQTFICILMCIFPFLRRVGWKYLMSSLTTSSERAFFQSIGVFRFYGIAGPNQFLSSVGTVSALLFLLSLFGLFKTHKFRFFLTSILLLLPAFLNARSGVICAIFGAFILCFIFLWKEKNWKFCILTMLGIILSILLLSQVMQNEYFHNLYPDQIVKTENASIANDDGENIFDNNELKISDTSRYNSEHWSSTVTDATKALISGDTSSKVYEWYGGLLPGNWLLPEGNGIWFGYENIPDVTVEAGQMIGRTDAGYVQLIWLGGIVLLLLVLFAFLFVERANYRNTNSAMLYSMTFCVLVAGFKGNVFFQTPVVIVLLLITDSLLDT